MGTPIPEGIVAVVKADCPTCRLVVPVLGELRAAGLALTVVTQDDPAFPDGLDPVDDTELDLSVALDLDTVHPPVGGRAPGWDAGVILARRQQMEPGARQSPIAALNALPTGIS